MKGIGRIGRFSVRGFVAWWIWRTFYLLRMPRWNRRARIAFDWTISLFFKDVQGEPRPSMRRPKSVPMPVSALAQVIADGEDVRERPDRLSPAHAQ